jgi:peptide-methionine (R)-S-oxide reductase
MGKAFLSRGMQRPFIDWKFSVKRGKLKFMNLFVRNLFLILILITSFASNTFAETTGESAMKKSDDEYKKELSPEQFHVCRLGGTERPFSGAYVHSKEKGTYMCSVCGNPLFSSDTKFDSGTGWPSFFQPIDKKNVEERVDTSHSMTRTEVVCSKCGSHLGHVFEDGPDPTGQRYCINSVSLKLDQK